MYVALAVVLLVIIGGYFLFKASRDRSETLPAAAPKAAPVIKENWLVGVGGEVEGRSFLIGQRILTIGRTPQNAVHRSTAQATNSPVLHDLVQKTYAAMDGDVERTAKALGVEAEIVQRILDEKIVN